MIRNLYRPLSGAKNNAFNRIIDSYDYNNLVKIYELTKLIRKRCPDLLSENPNNSNIIERELLWNP